MITFADLLLQTKSRLKSADIKEFSREAEILMEWATGKSRLDFIVAPETSVTSEMANRLHGAIRRRLAGEPVYRILGQREFYGLPLALSKETLEPRSDTEIVVDALILRLQELNDSHSAVSFLDMGTGSGAIAIAALYHIKNARALGVDISQKTLDIALQNARAAGVADRLTLLQSDWFANVQGQFDIIVSNPPYIPQAEIAALAPEVRLYDPIAALDGGLDGLDFYRRIATDATKFLSAGGEIIVEIGYDQANDIEAIFAREHYTLVKTYLDLNQICRVLVFNNRTIPITDR